MLVLAVETSCDDTSTALIEDEFKLLAYTISSQNQYHERFGGIVPEIAARKHLENITYVLKDTLEKSNKELSDIDGVCCTLGPGLVGSLLVGVMFAKGIAQSLKKPFFGVNHIEGHFFAPFLERKRPSFPFTALVASGGHTAIYLVKGFRDYELYSQTRDDAAGESFDKVAKILGLGYPGGPAIQELAGDFVGDIELPTPLLRERDFSFSGLKTAALNLTKKNQPLSDSFKTNLAASFQRKVVEILVEKTILAAKLYGTDDIVVSGGVSANKMLRAVFEKRCKDESINLFIPTFNFCTDNAAMIGIVGHYFLSKGITTPLSVSAMPDWSI